MNLKKAIGKRDMILGLEAGGTRTSHQYNVKMGKKKRNCERPELHKQKKN